MCWRTYFSWIQAQGRKRWKEEYIILYTHARERKQRKAERKYGDTEGHCMTPGSWHVQHPDLGMFDIRVSACSTPGSRHVRHPGVGHKKKTNGTNGTGRRRYGNMQRKERQKEKRQRKGYKKNNDTVKEQKTQKKGERRLTAWKTRSKPQPDKPVKGRCTLY